MNNNKYYINNNKELIFSTGEKAESYAEKMKYHHFCICRNDGKKWEYFYKGKYRYIITSFEGSSRKFGNCQVCNSYASEIFYQIEQKKISKEDGGDWTEYKCNNYIGHKSCLIRKQRYN